VANGCRSTAEQAIAALGRAPSLQLALLDTASRDQQGMLGMRDEEGEEEAQILLTTPLPSDRHSEAAV